MSRNRKKFHESLTYQVEKKLESKLAIGESKHKDKEIERAILTAKRKISPNAWLTYEERICIHKIYSWSTFKSYLKHDCYFVKWCKKKYN